MGPGSRRSRPARGLEDFATSPPADSHQAGDDAVNSILWPKLAKFLPSYSDIKAEIVVDYGLADIVAQRYDAGVRFGEQVAKDMIAVCAGPDVRFGLVGAKSYFAKRPPPKMPQGRQPCLMICAFRLTEDCTPGSSSEAAAS